MAGTTNNDDNSIMKNMLDDELPDNLQEVNNIEVIIILNNVCH